MSFKAEGFPSSQDNEILTVSSERATHDVIAFTRYLGHTSSELSLRQLPGKFGKYAGQRLAIRGAGSKDQSEMVLGDAEYLLMPVQTGEFQATARYSTPDVEYYDGRLEEDIVITYRDSDRVLHVVEGQDKAGIVNMLYVAIQAEKQSAA
jgi:hypothetical protein